MKFKTIIVNMVKDGRYISYSSFKYYLILVISVLLLFYGLYGPLLLINVELKNSYTETQGCENDFDGINRSAISNNYQSESSNIPNAGTRGRGSSYSSIGIYTVHGGSLAGGIGHGNFDDDKFDELVIVGGSSEGRTVLVDYDQEKEQFDSHLLWWDPNGALMDVVVGDLEPTVSGQEILVGGFSGNLTMISSEDIYNSDKVYNETIWNTPFQGNDTSKLIHIFGLAVGDLDELHPGLEIAVADATTNDVYILTRNGSIWKESRVTLQDLPRNVYIGDFDAQYPGDELLVVCVNGSVYRIAHDIMNKSWFTDIIYIDTDSPMSGVIDDFLPNHPGDEIIIAGLSRNAVLLWGSGNNWSSELIWHAPGALEGIAYGDFDELHPGKELIIAGYSNSAVMIYKTKSGWYTETIFYDPNPLQTELNGAVVADFYPGYSGSELLVTGFTGNVTMLIFEPPNFSLKTPNVKKTIAPGDFTTFRIVMEPVSEYNESIRLSVVGLPDDTNYSFSRNVLTPYSGIGQETDAAVLTIDTYSITEPGEYSFEVFGVDFDDNKNSSLTLLLVIEDVPPKQNFKLKITPGTIQMNITKNELYSQAEIKIIPENGFNGNAMIFIPDDYLNSADVKNAMSIQITPNILGIEDTSTVNISISEGLKESRNYSIPIIGMNSTLNLESQGELIIEILYHEEPIDNNDTNGATNLSMDLIAAIIILLFTVILLISFIVIRSRAVKDDDSKDQTHENAKERDKD